MKKIIVLGLDIYSIIQLYFKKQPEEKKEILQK
jgi:hypothetical protein